MRITDIRRERQGDEVALSARIVWEETAQPDFDLYFKMHVDEESLAPEVTGEPFLLSALFTAYRLGEKRVFVDAPVCPQLIDNLRIALTYINDWYWYEDGHSPGDEKDFAIEAACGRLPRPAAGAAGAFFSGGVDSLHLIQRNHSVFPPGHPFRVRDAIFIHGFDFGWRPDTGPELDFFEEAIDVSRAFLDAAELQLVRVDTNIRALDPNNRAWQYENHGACAAAVAHALQGRIDRAMFASSFYTPYLFHWGSHPRLDARFSSADLTFHHCYEDTARFDKVAEIAEFDGALDILRVCFYNQPGRLNCGRCVKCMRTKLELLCAGITDLPDTFADKSVDIPSVKKALKNVDYFIFPNVAPIMVRLKQLGHKELAQVVGRAMLRPRLRHYFAPKEILKLLDRRLLGARIRDARLRAKRRSNPET